MFAEIEFLSPRSHSVSAKTRMEAKNGRNALFSNVAKRIKMTMQRKSAGVNIALKTIRAHLIVTNAKNTETKMPDNTNVV